MKSPYDAFDFTKNRSKRYKAYSDLVENSGLEPLTSRV